MYITLSVIIVVASVLLTLIVLVQNSKGGGLAANFAAGNTTFGVRQTADFLEKTTWVLAAVVLVLCVVATFFTPKPSSGSASSIENQIQQAAPAEGEPEFPANTMAVPAEEGAAEAPAETPAE
ncbi:MAG: preprotein translocase subunit SecG [Bacteroidales bacterium]|nr:preprotein translocase subunit SecG [Bacteroidales bacterium]